jgi:hypothetical protein
MFSLISFIILSFSSFANLTVASPLNQSQLLSVTESVGLPLATSYTENLFPLGGYSGIRIGLSHKEISNNQLRQSYPETSNIPDLKLTEFHFSKGLYSNVDFYISFIPLGGNGNLSSFAGGIKWGFLELDSKPIQFLVSLSGRSTNWTNQVTFLNQTFDVIGQYSINQFYGYLGIGSAFVRSQFIGGSHGITLSGFNETLEKSRGRPLIGGGWQTQKWGVGLELTQFLQTTMTLKVTLTDFYDF